MVGITTSSDFPTTAGAYQTGPTGGSPSNDIFVSCLDAALANLTYSTYIGSTREDGAWEVVVDRHGDVIVTGFAKGSSFPITSGAYQGTFGGGVADGVVFKLRPQPLGPGQGLLYSTFVGGPDWDFLHGLVVESSGVIMTCGWTWGGLQTTRCAMQSQFVAPWMGFVMRLDPAGGGASDGHYLSYLGGGGGGVEAALGITQMPDDGRVAVAGTTHSAAFPTTPGAYQPTLGGGRDGIVAILDLIPANVTRCGSSTGACVGIDVQIDSMPTPGAVTELICNDAPPSPTPLPGALAIGVPGQLQFLGVTLWTLPIVGIPVMAQDGAAHAMIPIPSTFQLTGNVAFQFVWPATAACAGSSPLAASDALKF